MNVIITVKLCWVRVVRGDETAWVRRGRVGRSGQEIGLRGKQQIEEKRKKAKRCKSRKDDKGEESGHGGRHEEWNKRLGRETGGKGVDRKRRNG